MSAGDGLVIGLTNNRRDSWIWESLHDFVCGTYDSARADGAGAIVNMLLTFKSS